VESAHHDVHGKIQAFVEKTTKVYKEHEELYKGAKETFDGTLRPTLSPHEAKQLKADLGLNKKASNLAIIKRGKQNAEADLRSVQEAMDALHERPELAEVWVALRAKEQQEVEESKREEEKEDMEVDAMPQALPPGSVFGRITAALFGGSV
jgi:hypothetical protein